MALQERQLDLITWDKPGTSVEGWLLRVEKVKYEDGVGLKYVLRQRDGKLALFKGATRLDMLLMPDDVGKIIRVEFVGEDATKEARPGFNQPKVFRVAVDEASKQKADFDPALITDADIPF